MVYINLPKEDWDLIVEAIDYHLYCMDQENHFSLVEPEAIYYELIVLRDYILFFTTPKESIE